MVMTRPPAYHPGNSLMKNMNPTNSGLIVVLQSKCYKPTQYNSDLQDNSFII